MYNNGQSICFTSIEVKLIRFFLEQLRQVSGTSVKQLCLNAHVSTRTYAKIRKLTPVKSECYYRLLIGITLTATYEEFLDSWLHLGQQFYNLHNI